MKPMFKYIDKYTIKILDEDTRQEIGKIESPAATITGKESAIQVCGFDYACSLWGCGVYGYTDKDGNYHAKKDIQLLWTNASVAIPALQDRFKAKRRDGIDTCLECYSNPCKCEELKIYKSGEPLLDKL